MKTVRGIAVTDEVNRYNEIFSLQAMYSAYEKQWDELMPSYANHNHTHSIGFSKLGSIFLEPQKAYLTTSTFIAENKEEMENVRKYNSHHLTQTCIEPNAKKYEVLLEKLKTSIVGETHKCWVNGVSIYNEGIVERVFPDLVSKMENGLINIRYLSSVLPGIYKIGDFLIFAHLYFRRGYSYTNTLNTAFLSRIEELSSEFDNVRIAIDMNCIGLAGTEHKEYEYQYWWGPKFNDDLNSIPIGVTKHENEHYHKILSDICSTEFGWYVQDNKHTFECEEITDIPNLRINGNEMYACRFVHSMVDSETGKPVHLDGAIRAYSDETMMERLEELIKECDRKQYYKKLWRIDGEIPINKWKELITHYYRDNMMVGEYFGGEDDKLAETREAPNDPAIHAADIGDFIPLDFCKGYGIRINFAFSSRQDFNKDYDIFINSLNKICQEDTCFDYIESGTISLYKHLLRNGLKVCIPNVKIISFFDQVSNYPIIECATLDLANRVVGSIACFCNVWTEKGDDRLLSFTIKVPYNNRTGLFSFIGHIDDFLDYFNDGFKGFPQEYEIQGWLLSSYDYISKTFSHTELIHPYDVLETNYSLSVRRYLVPAQIIESFDAVSGHVSLILSEKEWGIINENHISAVVVLALERTRCSKCNNEYRLCECISVLDEGVLEIIEKATPIGLVWTNRSAFLK